jgi:deoxyribodipyrimidine photo-lyase
VHHDPAQFTRWCLGRTNEPLVDAAMHELLGSGYLSNRLRQVVASYLIHELHGDWRAGAAWFEAQLIDYDVYNNQGNWLYIAGMGTDPRGGRRFNVAKQALDHDPDQSYQKLWQTV